MDEKTALLLQALACGDVEAWVINNSQDVPPLKEEGR